MNLDNLVTYYNKNNTIDYNSAIVNKPDNANLTVGNELFIGPTILNTTSFADTLVLSMLGGRTTSPEVAFMFIKTYMQQLLKKDEVSISSEKLYQLFNKNQELIELPYALVLYLGGLHYFNEQKFNIGSFDNNTTNIVDQSTVFDRTNKILIPTDIPGIIKDPYYSKELLRTPKRYKGKVRQNTSILLTDINYSLYGTVYYPSTRIIDRSLINEKQYTFDYLSGYNDDQEISNSITLNSTNLMPAIGYGIQNNFLNEYNKFIYGDYLNGLSEKSEVNDGKPHSLIGGYCGISKPIKTFDSNIIEFTAFYRNSWVGGYSKNNLEYTPDFLYNQFSEAVRLINNDTRRRSMIQSFIVLAKIKALFLSDAITDDELLAYFVKLCSLKVADNQKYPYLLYLMVNYYFNQEYANNEFAESIILTENTAISVNETINQIATNITNYFKRVWSLERLNEIQSHETIDSTAVYGLYPSSGGFIDPFELFKPIDNNVNDIRFAYDNKVNTDSEEFKKAYNSAAAIKYNTAFMSDYTELIQKSESDAEKFNGFEGITNKNANQYYLNAFSNNFYRQSNDANDVMLFKFKAGNFDNVEKAKASFSDVIKRVFKEKNYFIEDNNVSPATPKYLLTPSFNDVNFLTKYAFNNETILKGTTRFLWFDPTLSYYSLKPDRNKKDGFYYDSDNGMDEMLNNSDYFTKNYFKIDDYDDYKKYFTGEGKLFGDQFSINQLLDSLDIEKLEAFKDEFLSFAARDQSGKFNIRTLMMASSFIGYNDIKDYDDDGYTLTADEINLLLIGNSMYFYDFVAKYGLNKFMNGALTLAQLDKAEVVIKGFCGMKKTIANFSTVGATEYDNLQFNPHLFPFNPDLMLSDQPDYDAVIKLYKDADNTLSEFDIVKYFMRKILFSDQYIDGFIEPTADEKNILIELNKKYIQNNSHITAVDEGADPSFYNLAKNPYDSKFYNDLYYNIVIQFYRSLNIKFDERTYKLLLRLIRSYVYNILRQISDKSNKQLTTQKTPILYINDDLLPGNPIKQYEDYVKLTQVKLTPIGNPQNDSRLNQSIRYVDFFNTISESDKQKYFIDFVKKTINGTIGGMSSFINTVNTHYTDASNPSNPNSYKNKSRDDNFEDFKKTTYYNFKQIYDKLEFTTDSVVTDIQGISKLDQLQISNIKDYNLFPLISFTDRDCEPSTKTKGYDLYQIFQILDRGNNDIGTEVLADLPALYNTLYTDFSNEYTIVNNALNATGNNPFSNIISTAVDKIYSTMAAGSGFNFLRIPNYLNMSSVIAQSTTTGMGEVVNQMFGVHKDTGLFGEDIVAEGKGTYYGGLSGLPGYIFQIGNTPSELNRLKPEQKATKYFLNSFCLDISINDKNDEYKINTENAPNEIKDSNVTSFIVDFGKQNQQMFTSLELDSSQLSFTEHSILNWTDYVNNSNKGTGTNTVKTSNLFPIYEKYMYTCQVSGLGNATIQPLSYFYLKNVPLFYGTYWITNVSHKISTNSMYTTFKGVRQPIATKDDRRRAILEQLKKVIGDIKKGVPVANTIQTIGIKDTYGLITKIATSNKPYGEYLQKIIGDTFYQDFDGKDILGTYIYSLSKSSDNTITNKAIIATLYNTSKYVLNPTTTDHRKILNDMVDLAIMYMEKAKDDGYKDIFNGAHASLSVLYKSNEGGYSLQSGLSNLLDKISSELVYKSEMKIDNLKDTVYGIVSDLEIKNDEKLNYRVDTKININSIDLSLCNMFIQSGYSKYNDTALSLPRSKKLYDVFNSEGFNNNKKISISKLVNTTLDKAKVTYIGTFSGDTNILSFFSTTSADNKLYFDIININGLPQNATDRELKHRYNPIGGANIQNQIIVKNYLKDKGLTKPQVAAIMGNIYKESKFNPLAVSKINGNNVDLNGYPSIGLIQWNGKFYGKSTDNNIIFNEIGRTVQEQLNYLVTKTDGYSKWVTESSNMNAYDAAFLFAKKVEKCADCTGTATQYQQSGFKAFERSLFAEKYIGKFNNSSDVLYWDDNTTTNGLSVTIGDSISLAVSQQYSNIIKITNPITLSVVNWTTDNLIAALNKANVDAKVSNVVLSIGSNDAWATNTKIDELVRLIKTKYPNAKYYILNGSYGWDNLNSTTTVNDSSWEKQIDAFIKQYESKGFTVIGQKAKLSKHPGPGDVLFNSFSGILSTL